MPGRNNFVIRNYDSDLEDSDIGELNHGMIENWDEVNSDNEGTRAGEDLESVVECPVCLDIPRDLPIPCCPAGHIICKTCRRRLLHCPTCRRQLSDNTSSLAAALIERVRHRCQFSEYGCQYRDYLCHLVKHELSCPERPITCPPPNGCLQKIQLKRYHEHAVQQGCSVEMTSRRTKFNLSKGWVQWDGFSPRDGEEFNLLEDLSWTFFHFTKFHHKYYLSAQYYAREKLFLFYVMVVGGEEVAENFRAHIGIAKESESVSRIGICPVLAVDRVPVSKMKLMMTGGCWCVHYRSLRPLLSVTEVGERTKAWSVDFTVKVDITNCMFVNSQK